MSFMGADVPVLTIERYHGGLDQSTRYAVTVSSKHGGWPMANTLVLSAPEAAKALRELAERIESETTT